LDYFRNNDWWFHFSKLNDTGFKQKPCRIILNCLNNLFLFLNYFEIYFNPFFYKLTAFPFSSILGTNQNQLYLVDLNLNRIK